MTGINGKEIKQSKTRIVMKREKRLRSLVQRGGFAPHKPIDPALACVKFLVLTLFLEVSDLNLKMES
jgi:hypothetical protein